MAALATVSVLIAAGGVMTFSSNTTVAYAQSQNANPEHTTRQNVWEFLYYVDNDNNPNTPPIRYTSGPLFSHQDCNERRDAIIAEGRQAIGTEYYPIESVEKCEIIKSFTVDTQKYCYTYTLITPDEILTETDCWNTKQECNRVRENLIQSGIEEISECKINPPVRNNNN